MGLLQAGLVVIVELGDEVDDLHGPLGISRAVEGNALLVEIGHEHGDLRDVEHPTGGDDVALAGGDQEHLIVLLAGIQLDGENRAGLQGNALHGSVLISTLQNAHTGNTVNIIVLDISAS